jgi:hypothetical protein
MVSVPRRATERGDELPDEARKLSPKDRPVLGWPLIGHPEPSEVG